MDSRKYQVHKKVKFNREERINAGNNSAKERLVHGLNCITLVFGVLMYAFLIIFPIGVAIVYKAHGFLVFYSVLMVLFTGLLLVVFSLSKERNSTLTLEDTEAHIEEDSVWGRFFYKRTIRYEDVDVVYHTEYCPLGLTPMAKNRKNPHYDKDLWNYYNGSYIVAVDNKNDIFGVVYQEEIWQFLKEHCKNATFYTKDEYKAEVEQRRALDREHDKYCKTYEGYIN